VDVDVFEFVVLVVVRSPAEDVDDRLLVVTGPLDGVIDLHHGKLDVAVPVG